MRVPVRAVRATPEQQAALADVSVDPRPWPAPLNLQALSGREPDAPQFILPDWLPAGYAALFSGHGGVGKSAIGLHLGACLALGLPFAGIDVFMRRVMYLSCEDRAGVLYWRLHRICRYFDIDPARLEGVLDIVELVGHDAILWDRDPSTGTTVTSAYRRLAERMEKSRAEVLIVDGISDTYGGNENARGDVKRFVNALVDLIPPDDGAAILIGHVAKPTANGLGGEGYSGSTAWHNSCRARWYLYPETVLGDDGRHTERTGKLLLELQKSNNGRIDQAIAWKWDNDAQLFIPEAAPTAFDRTYRDREERRGILLALKACANAGIAVPAATTGRRTAYHVVVAQSICPDSLRSGKPSVRRFWRQIEEMRAMGYIREDSIRRADRHYVATLTLTPEGLRACGQ